MNAEQNEDFKIVKSLAEGLTQEPNYLIEGLIEKGDQVLLYGQPKVGKTFLAIQLACALACQKPFLKWEVKSRRRVLYINFEMGERVFASRISKYLDQPETELPVEERAECFDKQLDGNLFFSVSPRKIELSTQKEMIEKLIESEKPDFVIFDTLTKLHSADERENNAIQGVLTEVRNVCENDNGPIAHMIVHHARKSSINITDNGHHLTAAEIRGGSAIRGEADVILGLASNSGGAGGGAKLKLIMEARNVHLEDLDLEVGEDRVFRPATIQTEAVMKAKFYDLLAAGKSSKSEIVASLAEEFSVKKDTVTREIEKWKKTDHSIRETKHSKDGRKKMIELVRKK